MDFSPDAMDDADGQVRRLRRRMAEWGGPAPLGGTALEFDRRFRDAVADDLDLPRALVIVNEAVAAGIPDGERFALLSSWDRVLGLDLTREVGRTFEPDATVRALLAERDAARASRDYATSDRIRATLEAMGLEVTDTPAGTSVRPRP